MLTVQQFPVSGIVKWTAFPETLCTMQLTTGKVTKLLEVHFARSSYCTVADPHG